jgi:phosphatidylinositol alpha 1,6-mannosyltransferase
LADFAPDVVHLASPFVLGWRAVQAAEQLGIPTVAIYQTEVPSYAARYGVPFLENWAWQRVENIHLAATRTLAPSSFAVNQLRGRGIPRVKLWRRGVDTVRFHPSKRDDGFRRRVAPAGERVIGFVGRLAIEKQVEDLVALSDVPNSRLVIVGDGPQRATLEALLPKALFTGFLGGDRLAAAVASFDLFVHPGELETFCQTIQEAMASGVPVVATGRGGPLDLVDSSRTGWLYTPGNLAQLRGYVVDLVGDDAKRAAFAAAAFAVVQGRTWGAVCGLLTQHYDDVIRERALLDI